MGGSHVASGVFGLVVAGVAWLEARTFPLQDLQEGLGAAFMPWLVLGLIAVLSASWIIYCLVGGTVSGMIVTMTVAAMVPFTCTMSSSKEAYVLRRPAVPWWRSVFRRKYIWAPPGRFLGGALEKT